MELSAVPREEYERLMRALGLALDTRELFTDGSCVAAQSDGCYFVDELVFHLAVGEVPVKLGPPHKCLRSPPTMIGTRVRPLQQRQ